MAHTQHKQAVQTIIPPEEPIVQEPIFEIVLKRLREDIVAGVYPFGTPMRMQDIARRFGTSLMPVREAFHHLAAEGLIVMSPRRGASVCRLDVQHVRQIFEFIKVLKGYAGRQAVERLGPEDLEQLHKLIAMTEANLAREEPDFEAHNALVARFYNVILARSNNEYIVKAIHTYDNFKAMLWQKVRCDVDRLRVATTERKKIVTALERKDGPEVERLIRLQIENSLRVVLSLME